MQISSENQEREITIFTNGQIPEVQVTTRREEAKENVNENLAPVIVVSENMEAVKGAAKYAQTFDDVLLNLPTIIKAIPAAETAVQAKDDAIAAKESAQESAETAQSAAVRAEETLSKMSRVMEYKGNVATFNDLPTTAKIGDVWNVLDTGANYAWDGEKWDKFGELVDLSGYYTKEEAQTALAEKQDILEPGKGVKIEGNVISVEGGDGNAYTKENLIGGKGVEIVKEIASEGIDENTLACWHFDTDHKDAVNKLAYGSYLQANTEYKKFGQASNKTTYAYEHNLLSDASSDWTIEGFFRKTSVGAAAWVILGKGTYFTGSDVDGACFMLNTYNGTATLKNAKGDTPVSLSFDKSNFEDWEHVAFQRKGGLLQGFHKGKKILEKAVSADGTPGTFRTGSHSGFSILIDEARISNVARYDGDFEPPTKPFSDATYETGRSTIEAEGKADKDLGNIPSNYDYVVESKYPTEDDPSWYRVYKSGWVEQGGLVTFSNNQNAKQTINFLLPMKDTNYSFFLQGRSPSRGTENSSWVFTSGVTDMTSTKCLARLYGATSSDLANGMFWRVNGQGAE